MIKSIDSQIRLISTAYDLYGNSLNINDWKL